MIWWLTVEDVIYCLSKCPKDAAVVFNTDNEAGMVAYVNFDAQEDQVVLTERPMRIVGKVSETAARPE